MTIFDHVLNITGFGNNRVVGTSSLVPGRQVTYVTWDGCMAEIRNVRKVGKLVRLEKKKVYGGKREGTEGIIVDYGDGKESWEFMDHVRIVNGAIEVWK